MNASPACRQDEAFLPGQWEVWLWQRTWCQAGSVAQPSKSQLCRQPLLILLDQEVLRLQVAVGYAGRV